MTEFNGRIKTLLQVKVQSNLTSHPPDNALKSNTTTLTSGIAAHVWETNHRVYFKLTNIITGC